MTVGSSTHALHVDTAGDPGSPLVVLVHGAMDRSAGLLRLSRRLDRDHHVVRYDRRGYGRSRPHPGPFSMDAQVADLVAVLAGRPAVLVGHSYGGNVALAVADRHPSLVRGVAVYESPLSWEPWWPRRRSVASHDHPAEAPVDAAVDAVAAAEAAEEFMRRFVGDDRWEALPERTREVRRAEGVAMVAELADLRAHRPWRAERIQVPVVFGAGSLGLERHRRGMAYAAGQVAHGRYLELAGCDHGAPHSQPDRVRHELIEPLLEALGE